MNTFSKIHVCTNVSFDNYSCHLYGADFNNFWTQSLEWWAQLTIKVNFATYLLNS